MLVRVTESNLRTGGLVCAKRGTERLEAPLFLGQRSNAMPYIGLN